MTARNGPAASDGSPHALLGVAEDADPQAIRAAYLAKVKEFPPDREPRAFERIRDAYEQLKASRQRSRDRLLAADPVAPIRTVIDQDRAARHVGPEPWLALLRERR